MPEQPLVELVHWKAEELAEREARIRDAGFSVQSESKSGMDAVRAVRSSHPVAVVIDLARLPSHGRETAVTLRQQKATSGVPIVFVGGDPEKVDRIRMQLPDAEYVRWSQVKSALRRAMRKRSGAAPAPLPRRSPSSTGYSGTPLPRKLGIKPESTLALVNAPADFTGTLGALPPGVAVKKGAGTGADLVVAFVRSRADLRATIARLSSRTDKCPVWIAWPKKTSSLATDVSETDVRASGLASGMVDYKICAIDADWSGLLFSRKRSRS
jgi:CheY-like chemotaxis protein